MTDSQVNTSMSLRPAAAGAVSGAAGRQSDTARVLVSLDLFEEAFVVLDADREMTVS